MTIKDQVYCMTINSQFVEVSLSVDIELRNMSEDSLSRLAVEMRS